MHPVNMALRFLLELSALGGFGVLVWTSVTGSWRILVLIIVLCFLMALWGTFAVPNDPSRSGDAPVPVSGLIRLTLECAILFGGALSFHWAGFSLVGAGLAALVLLHYVFSRERIGWLLQQ